MSLNSFGALISPACEVGVLPRLLRITDTVYLLGRHFGCFRGSVRSRLPSMNRFKPQLDKPKDGFGPCRFVALFSCPGVHTFTQFGRKTDGRYGIMPGGATAFLCTRSHMLPFLFTFIIYRPSGDLPSQRRKAAMIPALPGVYALWAVCARCAGRDAYTLDGSESV